LLSPLAGFKGPTSKGKEGRRWEGERRGDGKGMEGREGREGKRRKGKEGEGKEGKNVMPHLNQSVAAYENIQQNPSQPNPTHR